MEPQNRQFQKTKGAKFGFFALIYAETARTAGTASAAGTGAIRGNTEAAEIRLESSAILTRSRRESGAATALIHAETAGTAGTASAAGAAGTGAIRGKQQK